MTTPKQETAASEGVRALTKELAEAREELRLTVAAHSAQRALLRRATYPTDCVEFREYISWREALDAHRAKPSPQSPRGESGAIEGILDRTLSGGVKIRDTSPPYETAPTLEKGVRYRVEREDDPDYEPCQGYTAIRAGETFVATGEEKLWDQEPWHSKGGWYAIRDGIGLHRVVRVESAPTVGERAAAARQAIEIARLDAEESAPADDGPKECCHGRMVCKTCQWFDGRPSEFWLGGAAAVVPVTPSEPRLMGPLEDRVRRLERMMTLKDDLAYEALAQEIRDAQDFGS